MAIFQPFGFLAGGAAAPSIPIPTTNLVMFWNGTTYSGTGDWIDDYNSYDLAAYGSVTYDTPSTSWDFPGGSSDYMLSSQNNPITGSMNRTIIAYAYHDTSSPRDNTYVSIGFPGYPSVTYEKYTHRVDSGTSKLRTEIDGGYSYDSTGPDIPTGKWVFVASILDGTTLNGVKFSTAWDTSSTTTIRNGSPNNSSTIDTNNNYIILGRNNYNTTASPHSMEGQIKFVAIYDAALTQSELQAVYDAMILI